jgi:hypothetical protein
LALAQALFFSVSWAMTRRAPGQHGEVRRVLRVSRLDKGVHRGDHGVVVPYAAQGVEKNTFAVGSGAVEEEQDVLDRDAGHAVTGHALQVFL